ncbi:MAG: toll/interleukin-1 receptor domain-containing protein [Bryobacteraceae bacterium]
MTGRPREKALLKLINRCLCEGFAIEIDGLGRFDLDSKNQVMFEPSGRVRIFLAYADEDQADVKKLYQELHKAGFEPWMDREKLLPGQNWPRAIERAIELSDFVLACFSHRSTVKRGHFQCELRCALEVAGRLPLEDIFLVPLRLDDCDVPRHIKSGTQYMDLCPDWDSGVQRLIKMIRREMIERNKRKKAG